MLSLLNEVVDTGQVPALMALLALLAVFGYFGLRLTLSDCATHRLPNRWVLQWLISSLLLISVFCALTGQWERGGLALAGGAILLVGYALLNLAGSGAMGMGDVKLAAVLGANLGFVALGAVFTGTVLAFVLASLFVLGGVLLRRLALKSRVPFGPFMVIGAALAWIMTP